MDPRLEAAANELIQKLRISQPDSFSWTEFAIFLDGNHIPIEWGPPVNSVNPQLQMKGVEQACLHMSILFDKLRIHKTLEDTLRNYPTILRSLNLSIVCWARHLFRQFYSFTFGREFSAILVKGKHSEEIRKEAYSVIFQTIVKLFGNVVNRFKTNAMPVSHNANHFYYCPTLDRGVTYMVQQLYCTIIGTDYLSANGNLFFSYCGKTYIDQVTFMYSRFILIARAIETNQQDDVIVTYGIQAATSAANINTIESMQTNADLNAQSVSAIFPPEESFDQTRAVVSKLIVVIEADPGVEIIPSDSIGVKLFTATPRFSAVACSIMLRFKGIHMKKELANALKAAYGVIPNQRPRGIVLVACGHTVSRIVSNYLKIRNDQARKWIHALCFVNPDSTSNLTTNELIHDSLMKFSPINFDDDSNELEFPSDIHTHVMENVYHEDMDVGNEMLHYHRVETYGDVVAKINEIAA